jgi:hypothetical protein
MESGLCASIVLFRNAEVILLKSRMNTGIPAMPCHEASWMRLVAMLWYETPENVFCGFCFSVTKSPQTALTRTTFAKLSTSPEIQR